MKVRHLRLPVSALFALAVCASASCEEAPAGRLDAFVELPRETPYVGEPLRLVLRSAVHARVASDRIEQPGLTDFDWQQYGVDSSSEELIDGFWMPAHTRTLMIYPLRAGRLTIEPFKWRVSYFTNEGDRTEIEFRSQPLTVDVRAPEASTDAANSWLPAKALRILDHWDPEPDRIPPGEMTRRTLTVEAEGLTADRLPPLPRFRAPGVITFAGPVERQTLVTDRGPIARAVYQWTVRPVATGPATAPAIRLHWFDISARAMREATAPERRIAFIGDKAATASERTGASPDLLAPLPVLAALLAFISTGAAAWLMTTSDAGRIGSWRRDARTWSLLRALRASARKDDIAAFRRALIELSKIDPDRWRRLLSHEDIAASLAAIDALIFARDHAPTPPPLMPLAREIASAVWRDDASGQMQSASAETKKPPGIIRGA